MRKSQIGRAQIGHNGPRVSIGTIVALMIAAPTLGVTLGAAPAHAQFSLDIRIGYAPPPLPYYEQPPLPGPDYIWVPGTWAWSDYIDDYYWVPGYWERPPEPGLMWTPAWWGWDSGAYRFHQGYWGHEVGWYGGIDYGHGYQGHGWDGGHWDNGHVTYNRAVINVTNVHVTNVYYAPVTVNRGPRVSYNGGAGGVTAQPRPEEMRVMNAPHIAPTPAQQQHVQQAAANPRAAASQITPTWHPPAVRRVSTDGAPIPREAALAHGGVGVPPQYQQQHQNPNMPAAMAPPRPNQAAPGNGQPHLYNGQAPRPMQQQPAPEFPRATPHTYTPPPQGQPAPNYGHAAPQPYTAPPQYNPQQPRTAPQPHYQQPNQPSPNYEHAAPNEHIAPNEHPAPNYGRAAPPQPQYHAVAPPTAPRPAAPAPRPAPPPPRPAPPPPPHNDREHHEHP